MKKQLAVMALACGIAAFSPPSSRAADDCATQVMTTCTKCHYETRICENLAKKSRRDWQVTIKRMLRYGLVLDESGQNSLLECLGSLKSGMLCK